ERSVLVNSADDLEYPRGSQWGQEEERIGGMLPVVVVAAHDGLETQKQQCAQPKRSSELLLPFPKEAGERDQGDQPEINAITEVNVEYFVPRQQRGVAHAVLDQVVKLLEVKNEVKGRCCRERRGEARDGFPVLEHRNQYQRREKDRDQIFAEEGSEQCGRTSYPCGRFLALPRRRVKPETDREKPKGSGVAGCDTR